MNYGIGSSCLIVYSLDRCTPAGRNFFLKKVREEGNKKKIVNFDSIPLIMLTVESLGVSHQNLKKRSQQILNFSF